MFPCTKNREKISPLFQKNSAHSSDVINRAGCGWDMDGWDEGAGIIPGAIPPAAIPGAVLPGEPLHTHTALHHSCFCTGRVFWEAGEGNQLQGLPGNKSLLLTRAQDYFEAR